MNQATICTLLLLTLGTLPALAQTPDTTNAARYLPLEVGHVWEYEQVVEECLDISFCFTETVGYERWTVEADSIVETVPYRVLAQDRIDLEGEVVSTQRILVRFDTLEARGVRRLEDGSEIAWPGDLGCRLDAPFEANLGDCENESGLGPVFTYEPEDILVRVAGAQATRISKRYQSLIPASQFVADVGLLYEGGVEFGGSWITLTYARVGEVELGTERFPVSSEEVPSESAVALTVYPNPSRGEATARFSLDTPQRVRLSVFDVLGRRVLSADLGAQPAGEALHRLSSAHLPAGIYLIRLDGDAGAAATARVVRQ